MSRTGPIIILEDDPEDKFIFQEALDELGVANKLIWFTNAPEAFNYLKVTTDKPLIIFSDVNLPKQSGLDFKRQIDQDQQLRTKSIPFVFFSTSVDQVAVDEAYTQMTVQGFFKKSHRFQEVKQTINLILEYWKNSRHPNVA